MGVAVITGAAGLVGAEAVRLFSSEGLTVVGIDNDMRRVFFGDEASTFWCRRELELTVPGYTHYNTDIRNRDDITAIFATYSSDIELVIHTAAQPSHDWAARNPSVDFSINAVGTLTLLEAARCFCPKAAFLFTSTNKVYGDTPNRLPLIELDTRWEIETHHPYHAHGIDETMSIDQTQHSLFGTSKLAADAMVQEYGRYFGMKTACFRGGCITGPGHTGTMLHGFLAYLVRCVITDTPYTIFGYRGKQVRDNMHARDFATMFWHYWQDPRPGEVYNAGGGRQSHCSLHEAIALCEHMTGKRLSTTYAEDHRRGDHMWYISDTRKFRRHYPKWEYTYDLQRIVAELCEALAARRTPTRRSRTSR